MPHSRGLNAHAVNPAHLEALQARHAGLEEKIEREQSWPSTSPFYIRELKKMKLALKEEIETLRAAGSA